LGFLSIVSALKSNNNVGLFVKEAVRFIENYKANKKSTKKGGFYI